MLADHGQVGTVGGKEIVGATRGGYLGCYFQSVHKIQVRENLRLLAESIDNGPLATPILKGTTGSWSLESAPFFLFRK